MWNLKWVIFHQAALSDGGMSQGFITLTIKNNKNHASAQRIDLITRFQPFQAVKFAALVLGFIPPRTDRISFNLVFINLSSIYFSICSVYSISPKLNQPAFLLHPWLMPIFETPFFSRKTYGQNLGKIISSPVKSYELPEIDGKFPLLGKGEMVSMGPRFHPLGELGDMERNFQAPFYLPNLSAACGFGYSTNEGWGMLKPPPNNLHFGWVGSPVCQALSGQGQSQ